MCLLQVLLLFGETIKIENIIIIQRCVYQQINNNQNQNNMNEHESVGQLFLEN